MACPLFEILLVSTFPFYSASFLPNLVSVFCFVFKLLLFSSQEKKVCPWYVQHAAIWHWYLLLCICILFLIFCCICPFLIFYTFKKNLVLINLRNGLRYQQVLALCAVLTGAIPKGLFFEHFVFDVCVCFLESCVRTDFVVFG